MLKGILKKFTEKKMAPLEQFFFQRVALLKSSAQQFNLHVRQFPEDTFSALRNFLLRSDPNGVDPEGYYYLVSNHPDPLGWRRYKQKHLELAQLSKVYRKYKDHHRPRDEAYKQQVALYTWRYNHLKNTIPKFSPSIFMIQRIQELTVAFQEFESLYQLRWEKLKTNLKKVYDKINLELKNQPVHKGLLALKDRFENEMEDGLDETEYCINPPRLAELEQAAEQLKIELMFLKQDVKRHLNRQKTRNLHKLSCLQS